MPFGRIAEHRIREAIEDGRFDNLPGRGRPIDLEEYFKLPEHLRLAYSILKSANCVPEEVELLNEIAALDRRMAEARDEDTRGELARERAARQVRLALCLERARGESIRNRWTCT